MADNVEEAIEASPAKKSGNRKNIIMLGILLGVMLLEGVVVFVLVKTFVAPSPEEALAAQTPDGLNPEEGDDLRDVEVKVADFSAQNEQSPRVMIYRFVVYAVVSEADSESFMTMVDRNKAKIEDRFTRVVRGMDPKRFAEPDLSTLRAHLKHELSQLAKEETEIKEVLLPSVEAFSDG